MRFFHFLPTVLLCSTLFFFSCVSDEGLLDPNDPPVEEVDTDQDTDTNDDDSVDGGNDDSTIDDGDDTDDNSGSDDDGSGDDSTDTDSNDDDSNTDGGYSGSTNDLNQIPLEELETKVTLEGASETIGVPPSIQSDLVLDIESNDINGVQDFGALLEILSDLEDVEGAYIRFIDEQGIPADTYYDLPLNAAAFRVEDDLLDEDVLNESVGVQFSFDNLSVGIFCFEICLYDAQTNISNIETVCVTINSWGGDYDIVGSWNRIEETFSDDFFDDIYLSTYTCDSGQEVEAEYFKEEEDIWEITFDANGDYSEKYYVTGYFLDIEATELECIAVYETNIEVETNDLYSGKWSYNPEKKEIITVDYDYDNLLDADPIELYPDGQLYLNGDILEVVSGNLELKGEDAGIEGKVVFEPK